MKCSGLLQGDWLDWIFSLKLLANEVDYSNAVEKIGDWSICTGLSTYYLPTPYSSPIIMLCLPEHAL